LLPPALPPSLWLALEAEHVVGVAAVVLSLEGQRVLQVLRQGAKRVGGCLGVADGKRGGAVNFLGREGREGGREGGRERGRGRRV